MTRSPAGAKHSQNNTMRIIPLLLLVALISGCASHKKPKSETHIYRGDAPTIKYEARQERAGGALKTY